MTKDEHESDDDDDARLQRALALSKRGEEKKTENARKTSEEGSQQEGRRYAVYIENPTEMPATVYVEQTKRSIIGCLTHSQIGSGKLAWEERGWHSESDFAREFQNGLEKSRRGLCARNQSEEEAKGLVEALRLRQLQATLERIDFPETALVDQRNIPKRQRRGKTFFSARWEDVDREVTVAPGGPKIFGVGIAIVATIFDEDGLDFIESKMKTFFAVLRTPDQKSLGLLPREHRERIQKNGISWNENGWVGGQLHFSICANMMVKEKRQFLLAYNITQRRAHVMQARLRSTNIKGSEVLKRSESGGMSRLLKSPILLRARRTLDGVRRKRKSFKIGDSVILSEDEVLVRALQIGHGGWTSGTSNDIEKGRKKSDDSYARCSH